MMKNLFISFALLLLSQHAFSQIQFTTFYTKDGKQTQKQEEAHYYRIFLYPVEEGQKPVVEEYYISTNELKLKGTYKDTDARQFVGEKYEMYENGNVLSREKYSDDGLLIDTAYQFYESGILHTAFYYPSSLDTEGKLKIDSPLFLVHCDSTGAITLKNGNGYAELSNTHAREYGNYVNHKREGEWGGWFLDDKYTFTENYQDGKLISGISTDEDGIKTPYDSTTFEVSPEYPKGINTFRRTVLNNYKYPKEAIAANVSGKVILTFVIDKDGKMRDIVIQKDLGHGTGRAAIDALRGSGKWSPGIIRGVPVRVSYTLPISLSIH
ncbi:energy transducer TonB [Sphingobacterium wenxiniae]|uniref:TonB family C-terminal domain-containing protein n=1 Tax=Sphingobacterium wenxiniae TaxID=683125 RepID=A0A1I6UMR5_9SPHI|nr:energy transducer TonB [Sphingobacterium wenxiniae]SFT02713.1 TonB family C-terminal domain-containing protein [Sphingobacterium wenxiniae]